MTTPGAVCGQRRRHGRCCGDMIRVDADAWLERRAFVPDPNGTLMKCNACSRWERT